MLFSVKAISALISVAALWLMGCADDESADELAAANESVLNETVNNTPMPPVRLTDKQLAGLRAAENIHQIFHGWWNIIPDCPCNERKVPQNWHSEPANQDYHPGATRCYRSTPMTKAEIYAAGFDPRRIDPGQQCCYDSRSQLITAGAAAGTPDLFSPHDRRSNLGHAQIDVGLFHQIGFKLYNQYWPPSGEGRCPANKI